MKKAMMIALAGMMMMSMTAQAAGKKKVRAKAKAKVAYIEKIGTVGDGSSMHVLELCTIGSDHDTLNVFIDDNTNVRNSHIVEGNIVKVQMVKTANGYTAKKIVGSADYDNAIGTWTKADPIDKSKRMGVQLDVNCKATSINMATLPYTRWELQGKPGKVLLFGKSIGNGQSFDVTTVMTMKNVKGKWMMIDDKTKDVYVKESEL